MGRSWSGAEPRRPRKTPGWTARPPLVAFLSDGAFAGGQLAALTGRWRRGRGKAVTPILLSGGNWVRSLAPAHPTGLEWFVAKLRRDGFDPLVIDARDPAAFAWSIFEMECRLAAAADASPCSCHPSEKPVPCTIAVVPAPRLALRKPGVPLHRSSRQWSPRALAEHHHAKSRAS